MTAIFHYGDWHRSMCLDSFSVARVRGRHKSQELSWSGDVRQLGFMDFED